MMITDEPEASPSKDRLPTQYSAGQFCHTCQTNQTLLNRMLSNYLPSEDVRCHPLVDIARLTLYTEP